MSKLIQKEFLASCAAIEVGTLSITMPDGTRASFGTGTPHANITIHDWQTISRSLSRGDIGFGEAYIDQHWSTDSLEDLLTLIMKNQHAIQSWDTRSFWNLLKFRFVDRILRKNSRTGSQRNIRSHYDVGNEFYQLWLDDTMTYSSALYQDGDDLQAAQYRKYDRILKRLGNYGEQILEIGCGWGGFAKRASEKSRFVTGLTLSPSQKNYSDTLLGTQAKIDLCDYRDCTGTFDHIVSIEMIEAVGEKFWPDYFSTIKARLREGGKAVIQAITVADVGFAIYRKKSDFIRHYTFPGGMLLCDQVIRDQAQRAKLKVTDSFAFGQDYAKTCHQWFITMSAEIPRIKKLGYNDQFIRGWSYYLNACAASFRIGNTDVVQVELQHI